MSEKGKAAPGRLAETVAEGVVRVAEIYGRFIRDLDIGVEQSSFERIESADPAMTGVHLLRLAYRTVVDTDDVSDLFQFSGEGGEPTRACRDSAMFDDGMDDLID